MDTDENNKIARAIACLEGGETYTAFNILKSMVQYRYCTNIQLSRWMSTRNAECYCGKSLDGEICIMTTWDFLHPFDDRAVDSPDTDGAVPEVRVRMRGDTEWHEPTVEYIRRTENNVNLYFSGYGDTGEPHEVFPGDRVCVTLTDDIGMALGRDRLRGSYCFVDGVPGISVDPGQLDGIKFLPTVFVRDCIREMSIFDMPYCKADLVGNPIALVDEADDE